MIVGDANSELFTDGEAEVDQFINLQQMAADQAHK